MATAVKELENEGSLALKVFPNPFSNQTTIEYNTPFVGEVNLEIYDISGNKVKSLVNKTLDNGIYKYMLNAKEESITSGIYIIKLNLRAN